MPTDLVRPDTLVRDDLLRIRHPSYPTYRRLGLFESGKELILSPKPFLWGNSIIGAVLGALTVGSALGWAWSHASPQISMWVAVVIGQLFIAGFAGIVTIYYAGTCKAEMKRGDLFVLDTVTGRVDLPREGQSFAADEVVGLVLTSEYVKNSNSSNSSGKSYFELNLITLRGDQRDKWAVTFVGGDDAKLGRYFKAIEKTGAIPVREFERVQRQGSRR